jgi:hypothetical protein
VSKADATLKNKTSQVILVRDGNRNVITMYNDFKGDTRDFAMVVPVPAVLSKADIRVIDQGLFQRLNNYSAPRLVEYYDANPCDQVYLSESKMDMAVARMPATTGNASAIRKKDYKVKVEAQYLVGEYDILILSAAESNGLKDWLHDNGYKIPPGAEEVLDPYIKSKLKFFVVKVNEGERKKLPGNFLRPIQIRFNSPRFMLPIRLGMANAEGDQDLVVYAFTRRGRIECTNYRNSEMPTGQKIPLFVQKDFQAFYENLFTHQWRRENEEVAFLEYAWDVSPQNFLKCDPCIAEAPSVQDLLQSGVWWLQPDWSDYSDVTDEAVPAYNSQVHFTRLHFRYNRRHFAQDLLFQVTPNTENFQARYVITHPASGNFDCAEGKQYLRTLKQRRRDELRNLTTLTGRDLSNWQDTGLREATGISAEQADYAAVLRESNGEDAGNGKSLTGLLLLALTLGCSTALVRWKGWG